MGTPIENKPSGFRRGAKGLLSWCFLTLTSAASSKRSPFQDQRKDKADTNKRLKLKAESNFKLNISLKIQITNSNFEN